jgi:HD superfamily phosphohydrolase
MPEEATIAGQATEHDGAEDVAQGVVEGVVRREGAAMRLPAASAPARRSIADELYGPLPVARWAQALLDLPPFARLAGVSLSDVPGALLFRRPFPSRLAHSLGVYYLARQARPRDRALHAAALAHDLGHGPFSHLTEPLMIERLGIDHERRSVDLLRQALQRAQGETARLLAWLDPDEVAALMLGGGPEGRGALLNGALDYDNIDNVARFLQASGLGEPSYDPRALARELRLSEPPGAPAVALAADGAGQAQAWLDDRRRVYGYLCAGERNLALHGMLRKAVDLAAQAGMVTPAFFDATDADALRLLREGVSLGAATLTEAVARDQVYARVWEVSAPTQDDALAALFAQGQARLALEERVALEAGLAPHEVVLSYTIARGERALPPILAPLPGRAAPVASAPLASGACPTTPERAISLLIARSAGRDYARRACMAVERTLAELNAQ